MRGNEMSYINLLVKNRKFIAIALIAYFVLCFVDTKVVGVIYREEDMIFRLLVHQVFLVFLTPILVLRVLNEKFLRIQKNYMVLYSTDEKININKMVAIILVTEVLIYILGQAFFQGINYLLTHEVYLISLRFNVLTIFEMLAASYIIVSILLILKKDLFTYTIFYIILMSLLVLNHGYITMPMTIKSLSLLDNEFLKLLVSRIAWVVVSFFAFRIALNRYSKNFYNE